MVSKNAITFCASQELNGLRSLYVPIDSNSTLYAVAHLSLEALDQVADSHTGRNGVRVDDNIRTDAFTREGHVLAEHTHTNIQLYNNPTQKC